MNLHNANACIKQEEQGILCSL